MKEYFAWQLEQVHRLVDETKLYLIDSRIQLLWTDDKLTKIYKRLYPELGEKYFRQSYLSLKKNELAKLQTKEGDHPPLAAALPPEELRGYYVAMQQHVDTTITEHIISVNETSRKEARKAIKGVVQEGLEQGYSIEKIKRNIDKAVDVEWRKMGKFRPRTIAHTEVLSASNYSSYQGALNTQIQDLRKVWYHSFVGQERPWHLAASGTSLPMKEAFIMDGEPMQHPGDGSARNVISCKCVLLFDS